MRIAIFADIHGNPFSTRAVLDAIADNGFFDAIVLAGDACPGGSDPATCIDMLQADDIQMVYGNGDEFVFASPEEPPTEAYRARWKHTYQESRWAEDKLGEDRLNWLREQPFELRFSPTERSQDDLLVVHANPKDVYNHILPSEKNQTDLFGKVHQPDNDSKLLNLFHDVEAAVMAFGHFHYTCERYLKGIRLVNVSPCSYSQFDPDRRARYTVFSWNGEWQIERKYVDYDYRQEDRSRRRLLRGEI